MPKNGQLPERERMMDSYQRCRNSLVIKLKIELAEMQLTRTKTFFSKPTVYCVDENVGPFGMDVLIGSSCPFLGWTPLEPLFFAMERWV